MKKNLINSKCNAFTLIELLAIIVILAIIAVITVPIILNIIENSKKGAAQDSAYGYKEAVEKYYVSELFDSNNFNLQGDYNIENGIMSGSGFPSNGVEIPLSGKTPSSGILTYENNKMKSGCLQFDEYAVSFNTNGTVSTEKGSCDLGDPQIETCPGCVFGKFMLYQDENNNYIYEEMGELPKATYTKNYSDLGNSFLGHIINSTTGKIEKSFACGKEGNKYFCFEGKESSKYVDNVNLLNEIVPRCNANSSSTSNYCPPSGDSLAFSISSNGSVVVIDGSHGCAVGDGGKSNCY